MKYFTNKHVLFLEFLLLNQILLATVFALFMNGLFDGLIASDKGTYISSFIVVLFLAGLLSIGRKIFFISHELHITSVVKSGSNNVELRKRTDSISINYLKQIKGKDSTSRQLLADSLGNKLQGLVTPASFRVMQLVLWGFIGTLVGFVIAFSVISPSKVGDVTSITPIVATFIRGAKVAIYTTLLGAVSSWWLSMTKLILQRGITQLWSILVELGESYEK